MNTIRIIDYQPRHQPYFEKLNRGWIEEHWEMEPRDIDVLTRPGEFLIASGGAVLVAEYEGEVAGVAGLLKVSDRVYEFTKMAVDKRFRRKGIAEQLCYASFRKAKELGAEMITLYSCSLLKPAITLYLKLGFKHIPVDGTYKRSDVKMEISMEDAMQAAANAVELQEK